MARPLWVAAIPYGALIYLLTQPVVALVHELSVLWSAMALHWLGSTGDQLVRDLALPADPVYTGAVFSLISDIQVAGLAVRDPLGPMLHSAWPSTFLDSTLVPEGSFASALVLPGAALVARGLCLLIADVALLTTGWILWSAIQKRPPTVVGSSVAIAVAAHQLAWILGQPTDARVSIRDLESMGLAFALSVLHRGAPDERPRVTDLLVHVPEGGASMILAAAPVGLTLVLSLLMAGLLHLLLGRAPHRTADTLQHRAGGEPWSAARTMLLVVPALALAISPFGDHVNARSRVINLDEEPALVLQTGEPDVVGSAPQEEQRIRETVAVGVVGGDFQYRYLVDGQPLFVQGVGYNVRYARLPSDERIVRYERDFAQMKSMGVNTLVGWETEEFDELLLQYAAKHDLGVAPPFALSPELDYSEPHVREALIKDALAWVERNRHFSSVRFWALGNEVLHKLVYPSWMPLQPEPWREQRATAFASFLVELTDRVRQADPARPVMYSDAEDSYARYVRAAFQSDGRSRPWFIYGINAYTPRLRSIIDGWHREGFDVPLLISEFAPGGLSSQDRPAGLRDMWEMVQAAEPRVIGGAVYAWTTDGPEEVDRVFGLVDAAGEPVDGALAAVASMFGGKPLDRPGEVSDAVATSPEEIPSTVLLVKEASLVEIQLDDVQPEAAGEAIPNGMLRITRAVAMEEAFDEDDTDVEHLWWVTWRPADPADSPLSLLVQCGGDGPPRVTYVRRGAQS